MIVHCLELKALHTDSGVSYAGYSSAQSKVGQNYECLRS